MVSRVIDGQLVVEQVNMSENPNNIFDGTMTIKADALLREDSVKFVSREADTRVVGRSDSADPSGMANHLSQAGILENSGVIKQSQVKDIDMFLSPYQQLSINLNGGVLKVSIKDTTDVNDFPKFDNLEFNGIIPNFPIVIPNSKAKGKVLLIVPLEGNKFKVGVIEVPQYSDEFAQNFLETIQSIERKFAQNKIINPEITKILFDGEEVIRYVVNNPPKSKEQVTDKIVEVDNFRYLSIGAKEHSLLIKLPSYYNSANLLDKVKGLTSKKMDTNIVKFFELKALLTYIDNNLTVNQ